MRAWADAERRHDLWNPMVQAWFPGGPQDARSILLIADVESTQYWHVNQSKATQMFQILKAAMTGNEPRIDTERSRCGAIGVRRGECLAPMAGTPVADCDYRSGTFSACAESTANQSRSQ